MLIFCSANDHRNYNGIATFNELNTNSKNPICVASAIVTKSVNATVTGEAFS
jgi:hypothetical protein